MAAPADLTGANISGKIALNTSLSLKVDEVFKILGASGISGIPHFNLKHYKDASSVEHIEVELVDANGATLVENRTLNGVPHSQESKINGAYIFKGKRATLDEIPSEWLKKNWLPESFVDGKLIHTHSENDASKNPTKWSMEQVWGLQNIGGEKKYVRAAYFTGPNGETVEGRLVYDYEGPL